MQDVCYDRANLAQMTLCFTFLGWGFIFCFIVDFKVSLTDPFYRDHRHNGNKKGRGKSLKKGYSISES